MLILSQYVEHTYAAELLADGGGGVGYLLKERVGDVGDFVDAVRRVAEGGMAMDPEVVAQLVARARSSALDDLTRASARCWTLMAEGRSNAAIAARCSSPRARSRSTSRDLREAGAAGLRGGPPPRARGAGVPARRAEDGRRRRRDFGALRVSYPLHNRTVVKSRS